MSQTRLAPGADLEEVAAAWRRDPSVLFVQPNYIAHNHTTALRGSAHGFPLAREEATASRPIKPTSLSTGRMDEVREAHLFSLGFD